MAAAGVHRTQISEYERGERVPKLITLERISRALDIPLDRFLAGADGREPSVE